MYYYVDTHEICKEPKPGEQWTCWFTGTSMRNREGREFTDIIKGEEVSLRAMTEEALLSFLKNAYTRAPWLKAVQITE